MKSVLFFRNACVVFFTILAVWHANGQAPESYSSEGVNIIVVLDTSDRISKELNPGQIQRDIKIVERIVTLFQEEFVRKHLLKDVEPGPYPHRLTFAVPDQPKAPPIPLKIMEKLMIKDSSKGEPFKTFEKRKDALLQTINQLYQFVEKENPFTGADIWNWFRKSAEHYLRDDLHNYIICLSDGYLKFHPDIEALLPKGRFMKVSKWRDDWRNNAKWREKITYLSPIGKSFSDYKVTFVMMEIKPKVDKKTSIEHPADLDIIKAYWEIWLKSMGITNARFFGQIPLTQIEEAIYSFTLPHEAK